MEMTKWFRFVLPISILFFIYFGDFLPEELNPEKIKKIKETIQETTTQKTTTQESTTQETTQDFKCRPSSNIVFLKTHKTGSSTIQNIFFRYGMRNKLWFAMPKEIKSHLLGKSKYE